MKVGEVRTLTLKMLFGFYYNSANFQRQSRNRFSSGLGILNVIFFEMAPGVFSLKVFSEYRWSFDKEIVQ